MRALRQQMATALLLLIITLILSAVRVPSAVAVYEHIRFVVRHDFALPASLGTLSQQIRGLSERLPRVAPRP